MRKRFLPQLSCILALLVLLTSPGARADDPPRVVAIIAGATLALGTPENPGIGRGVKHNVKRFEDMLEELRTTGGIPVLKYVAVGRNFGCAQINKILAKLQLKSNDTVVFYYAGHGLRSEAPATAGGPGTKFPALWCTYPNGPNSQDLHFAAVVNKLYTMGPRLVIGIADACNRESLEGPTARGGFFRYARASLRQLWLGYKGVLMFSAAIPGEDAYYAAPRDQEAAAYGFFSQQLFDAIEQEVVAAEMPASPPEWETIAAAATKEIPVPQVNDVQHPQFDAFADDPARRLHSIGLVP